MDWRNIIRLEKYNSLKFQPFKFSMIEYCLFQTPDCQLISYDFEDYDVFTDVIDCAVIYSNN